MKSILEKLKGGDFRSIGKANKVMRYVLGNPKLFKEIFEGMTDADPLIRMRAADVVEKIGKQHPEYLQPFKRQLIDEIAKIPQQEIRWHTAQMFSYLALSPKERNQVVKILLSWIEKGKSNIVKVMSLQSLTDFAKQDRKIKSQVMPLLQKFVLSGSPSLKSRSKRLLEEFAAKE
ncbi:hypothetical protein M1615_00555 [Patescibacteria group bacterium]|nr:hypothetical protein [Patescibacteria group bacterium]MCL5010224.1 hypothetical protein [Patescibacteria group bacterium]